VRDGILPRVLQASIQSQLMTGVSSASAAAPPVIEQEVEKSRTLHVGNLPPTLTEEQLKQIFGVLGPITDCRIAGDSRQFAFIEYEQPAQAAAALQVRPAPFITSPAQPRSVDAQRLPLMDCRVHPSALPQINTHTHTHTHTHASRCCTLRTIPEPIHPSASALSHGQPTRP
jgi:hypothetical protein